MLLLAEGEALHVGVAGHLLHGALGPAEQGRHVLGRGHEGAGDVLALGGQQLPGVIGGGIVRVLEHLGRFKQGELREVALVLRHGLAQVGQQRGADQPLGGRRRGGQGQDPGGVLQNGVDVLLVHPGIGEDLLHAAADGQIFLDPALQVLVQLVDGPVEGGGDGGGLEVLVAHHPGHLLHDVGLDGHIAGGAPGGHGDVHVVAIEVQPEAQQAQLMGDFVVGQVLAQAAVQPPQGHVDLRLAQLFGILVGEAGDAHVGIQLPEQGHGQGQGLVAALGVDGLFIPGGGLGAVVVPQGRAADAGGLEVGDLQNHLVGGGQDGVLGAAHDACKAHHPRLVGDDQVVGRQG